MRALFSALALTFVFASTASAEDKKYSIDVSGTTTDVKNGQGGVLKLHIKPADGHYISPEAPLKIALKAEQLKLSKEQLTFKDAEDQKAKAPKFTVDFKADKGGKTNIDADAVFFLCNENLCERKTEKVTVAVDVKP